MTYQCPWCKKEFADKYRPRKYCSHSCHWKHLLTGKPKSLSLRLKLRRANAWKYQKEILNNYQDGKTIMAIVRKYKSDKRTIRSVLKEQGITQFHGHKGQTPWNKGLNHTIDKRLLKWSGKNHYCWKGGITPLVIRIRLCAKSRNWKKDILIRDDWTCQICGKRGGDLIVDHYPKMFCDILSENKIKTFKNAMDCQELWELENGRTLCKSCNKKTFKFKGNQFIHF